MRSMRKTDLFKANAVNEEDPEEEEEEEGTHRWRA